ncbi:heavy-metal-associated domain-containing protein [Streptomyces tubbatahanensis]|uniref:Heavy-metal-associated domain-containing protein n=1 Tax=Streptomyces tubbatahanensis TaxID=2923272 RepID=A0ABY3XYG2_9ACTN|nr:heavy-metal-associated domain-containing protein [Streptomyces tubbatahanensis]UNS99497.1 heavy-metal-associated domain-containing protein [Streptomyces tubbatahanensis]
MTTRTYTVLGMACGHCAGFVTEELRGVPGVTAVVVDVEGDAVTVTSTRALALGEVRAAVDEAGYELASEEGGEGEEAGEGGEPARARRRQ